MKRIVKKETGVLHSKAPILVIHSSQHEKASGHLLETLVRTLGLLIIGRVVAAGSLHQHPNLDLHEHHELLRPRKLAAFVDPTGHTRIPLASSLT